MKDWTLCRDEFFCLSSTLGVINSIFLNVINDLLWREYEEKHIIGIEWFRRHKEHQG